MRHVKQVMGSLVIQHPFACSIAFAPIVSTAYSLSIHSEEYHRKDAIEEILLDWMMNAEEVRHKDMESLYPTMLKFSLQPTEDLPNIHPFTVLQPDLHSKLVQDCVDVTDVYKEYGLPPEFNGLPSISDLRDKKHILKSIRFNGNYSKFDLLRNVMSLGGIETMTLDLEDCTQLDNECLNAMLRWIRPRKLFLKGTPFIQKSQVWKDINKAIKDETEKKNVGINFGIDVSFAPRLTVNKLQRENERLKKDNAEMRKEIEELRKLKDKGSE